MAEVTEPSRRPALFVIASRSQELAVTSKCATVRFDRQELNVIFNLYGKKVAEGEWRDYALDFTPAKAVFSIFRRSCENPLYRIEKDPSLSHRQGVYAVVASGGAVLRRGHELERVVRVLDKGIRLVGD